MVEHTDDIIIVGAGLAGMTAGVYLSEAGLTVRIIEAHPFLGGRTSSWVSDGMPMESGLHRFLGFYTALPDILQKVGIDIDKMLYWEDEIEIRRPEGISAVMGLAPLHKPLKTAAAIFGNNDFLTPADKLSLGKMFAAAIKDYSADQLSLDEITVLAYAQKHGVTEQAIQRMLIPITEGIFFLPISEYSMFNLMGLFMPYLKTLPKLRVGAFMGGMSDVMMEPMAAYIRERRGTIQTGLPATHLLVEQGVVHGVATKERSYHAKQVLLATSLRPAQQLLRKQFATHPSLQDMFALPSMPAATFQMELKRPSMEVDRTTFGPGTALASFAEQSRTTFRHAAPGRLSVILSPPERFLDMADKDILEIVIADGEQLGLKLKDNVTAYQKVRLPHDFYALRPGSERLRPGQQTNIPGLILAGDYTKQPYLATMEGAVVSGKLAANIALGKNDDTPPDDDN